MMGPGKRLALLLASIRDASRLTAKNTLCLAGELTFLLSTQEKGQASGAPGLHLLQHSAWLIIQDLWHCRISGRISWGHQVSQHSFS